MRETMTQRIARTTAKDGEFLSDLAKKRKALARRQKKLRPPE